VLWGEHGLSFVVESRGMRLLLDTGQSGDVLRHNLIALGFWDATLDGIVLSHAHHDHTGGLNEALAHWPNAAVYAHPRIVDERLTGLHADRHSGLPTATVPAVKAWHLSATAIQVAPGIWTTGGITNRPCPLGSSAHHWVKRGETLLPDDYADDQSLILYVKGGVALLCGCCHAGLRNTVLRLREMTALPLIAIIGGTHLASATEAELDAIVRLVREEGMPLLYLCHCTGDRALFSLQQALADRVRRCSAGTVIEFPDASASTD